MGHYERASEEIGSAVEHIKRVSEALCEDELDKFPPGYLELKEEIEEEIGSLERDVAGLKGSVEKLGRTIKTLVGSFPDKSYRNKKRRVRRYTDEELTEKFPELFPFPELVSNYSKEVLFRNKDGLVPEWAVYEFAVWREEQPEIYMNTLVRSVITDSKEGDLISHFFPEKDDKDLEWAKDAFGCLLNYDSEQKTMEMIRNAFYFISQGGNENPYENLYKRSNWDQRSGQSFSLLRAFSELCKKYSKDDLVSEYPEFFPSRQFINSLDGDFFLWVRMVKLQVGSFMILENGPRSILKIMN